MPSTISPVATPVHSSIRGGSIPSSWMRYCFVFKLALLGWIGFIRRAGMAPRSPAWRPLRRERQGYNVQAILGFVVHAHGTLRSRANDRLHKGRVCGGGGGRIVTVVLADAVLPRSSTTLHFRGTMPTASPPVPRVVVLPSTLPACPAFAAKE
jgi:hypothetical protein